MDDFCRDSTTTHYLDWISDVVIPTISTSSDILSPPVFVCIVSKKRKRRNQLESITLYYFFSMKKDSFVALSAPAEPL